MASTGELNPAAVRVSPLIKFSRWSFLIAGVMWGIHRQKVNTKKEEKWQEFASKQRLARAEYLKKEKQRVNREEMLYMAEQAGIPIPPDFDVRFPKVA